MNVLSLLKASSSSRSTTLSRPVSRRSLMRTLTTSSNPRSSSTNTACATMMRPHSREDKAVSCKDLLKEHRTEIQLLKLISSNCINKTWRNHLSLSLCLTLLPWKTKLNRTPECSVSTWLKSLSSNTETTMRLMVRSNLSFSSWIIYLTVIRFASLKSSRISQNSRLTWRTLWWSRSVNTIQNSQCSLI